MVTLHSAIQCGADNHISFINLQHPSKHQTSKHYSVAKKEQLLDADFAKSNKNHKYHGSYPWKLPYANYVKQLCNTQ